MSSIAIEVGCTTEALRRLGREVNELRLADKILRKAPACVRQVDLDRHGKC